MPYVIRERLPTAGMHMYLLETPLMDNSVGTWTVTVENAKEFKTIDEANTVSRKLNVANAGVVEYYTPKEERVPDSDWVIKSNITNEYLVQAQIFREPELWSLKLKEAQRFKTAAEARDYSTEYLIGKATAGANQNGQSLDMDYIAVPKKKKKTTSGKDALFRDTSQYHFVVRCDNKLEFVQRLLLAERTVEWVTDIRKAKQYKYRTSAETAAKKVSGASIKVSVHVVNSRTHQIIQNKVVPMEKKMPEKKDFRVRMRHKDGAGYSVEVTFENTTETEALDRMFAEARKLPNKPFMGGRIRAHPKVTDRVSTFECNKSM